MDQAKWVLSRSIEDIMEHYDVPIVSIVVAPKRNYNGDYRKLESLLRRLNVQSWIGPDAVMKVVTLGHVKDWKSWHGSLLALLTVVKSDFDVICYVKRFASDESAAEGGTIVAEDAVPLPWHIADHEHSLVRLEDAPPNTCAQSCADIRKVYGTNIPPATAPGGPRNVAEQFHWPKRFLQKAQVETVARAAIRKAGWNDVIVFENTPFFEMEILKVYDLSQASAAHMRTELEASAAGSPMIDVSDLPKNAAVQLAGNAMHVAQAFKQPP
ncbi:hypothetical protein AK812_SmicGene26730 [Symbiodinium microadriaticum]|uniref:Uncharacterized protein n=1 Tax=Symbiodinium microadriaticum TaxID=2951 RepID=A0A1Q9D8Q3_SYMMI|nr:hypothetical protein AK812_SmicGene26730 [Symbiodinium microadriaticum]